jgi:SAM-dependent methyltransferase
MPIVNDIAGYWDHYADGISAQTREEALKNAFGWCQYEGHGPGDELLGDPASALELGSGRGNAVAALASKGIEATGIDVSAIQCEHARHCWGDLPGADFVHADVIEYLKATDRRWDAMYSIWGAVWFTDPDLLLPLVRDRLKPGGTLTFSHAPPVPGSYGAQGMYGAGFCGPGVWLYRWAYEQDAWAGILTRHGFTNVRTRVEPAPERDFVGTLVVEAHR